MLTIKKLSVQLDNQPILKDINLSINTGEIIGIVGTNGSGKTTLLNSLTKTLSYQGEIYYKNRNMKLFSRREWAKIIGLLEQKYQIPEYYTVFDLVMMGNYVHKKWWEFENNEDAKRVNDILQNLNLAHLKQVRFQALSGGEQQRVMLARLLLQSPEIILLDEPTNHLDVYFQIELLKQIRSRFQTIIAVFHDLNLATIYCDKIIIMNQGEIVQVGEADNLLNEFIIEKYFNVKVKSVKIPDQTHKFISLYHTLEEKNEKISNNFYINRKFIESTNGKCTE